MRHVDEGELHAYLDGRAGTSADERGRALDEHVAECAECRARLEEARRLRERARAILQLAGPANLSAPPFEDILARAAREKARPLRVRPATVLAWAASLAVAVTVGWYGRTLLSGPPRGARELARSTPIDAAVPEPARGGEGRRETARGGERRRDTAAESVTPPARAALAAGNRPAQEPIAEPKEAPTVATIDSTLTKARGFEAEARALPAAPAPAPAAAFGPPQPRLAAPALNEAGWTTVSEAEAARRLGGPIGRIPDLATLGYSLSGSGQATVVHTIQVLGPGVLLDLYQQRAAGAAAATRAARPNVRALRDEAIEAVSVDWEGFRVTARAAVPSDSLRRLLARLRVPR